MPNYPTRIRKTDDPGTTHNQGEILGKIIEVSNGLILEIIKPNDRRVFTFRGGFTAFNNIYGTMKKDNDFVFLRTYLVKNHDEDEDKEDPKGNTTIHKFQVVNSNSQILVKRRVSSEANNLKSWNYFVLLDPTEDLNIKAQEILSPYDKVTFSINEIALDFHLTDKNKTDDFTRSFNHYVYLKYSRANSYNQYEDTAWRAKNGKINDGPKGTRTYLKDENNQLFSRHELQSNRDQLRYLDLNIKNSLDPDSIDIFQFICFKHGLNKTTLDKVTNTFSKRFLKNNRDNTFVTKEMQNTLQEKYRELILSDLGITSPAELKSVPVQRQIDVFKEYNDSLCGENKNKVSTFFPAIDSWEELFQIIEEELFLLEVKSRRESALLSPRKRTNTTTYHHLDHSEIGEEEAEFLNSVRQKCPSPVRLEEVPDRVQASQQQEHDSPLHDFPEGICAGKNDDHASNTKGNFTFPVANKTSGESHLQGENITYPPKPWQEVGRRFLRLCRDDLRKSGTPWQILREYGIDSGAVEEVDLGWSIGQPPVSCKYWGLPIEYGILRIPEGLVIPQYIDFDLMNLIIISKDILNNHYTRHVIAGGFIGGCLAFQGNCRRTIVVSDDLDALFLKQEVGDLVHILSLGEADKKPDCFSQQLLRESSSVLLAIGNSLEGIRASQWWLDNYGGEKIKVLPRILNTNLYHSFPSKEYLRRWILSDLTGFSPERYLTGYNPNFFGVT